MSTPLRAARVDKGWSQTDAAREIVALGRRRGTEVAAAASLKTLLSRWENGHVVPEPQYRTLLAELFGRTAAELGIDPAARADESATEAARLRSALAAADAVDDAAVALWHEQLAVARRLDDELGGAGAGGVVRAQVEQLDRTLAHTLRPDARAAVAAVLADTAALAGEQALDAGEPGRAWHAYQRARSAATEAGQPVAAATAVAGLAAVLVEIEDPRAALILLGGEPPGGPPAAGVRLDAATGLAQAASGCASATHEAFSRAERSIRLAGAAPGHDPGARPDLAWPVLPAIELTTLHRRHSHALAVLGDPSAVPGLERALATGPRSARHRAGLHADLAVALSQREPEAAAHHARTAREIAARIGSTRIPTRLGAMR